MQKSNLERFERIVGGQKNEKKYQNSILRDIDRNTFGYCVNRNFECRARRYKKQQLCKKYHFYGAGWFGTL